MQARSALGPRRSGMPIRPERGRCACARARSRTGPQWALQPSGTGASHHDVPRSRRLQRSAGRLPSCPGAPLCLVNCVQRLPPRHDALRVVGSTCPSWNWYQHVFPNFVLSGNCFFAIPSNWSAVTSSTLCRLVLRLSYDSWQLLPSKTRTRKNVRNS